VRVVLVVVAEPLVQEQVLVHLEALQLDMLVVAVAEVVQVTLQLVGGVVPQELAVWVRKAT
jgi:hypothetical protein